MCGHAAHIGIDGHAVVVENHHQPLSGRARVVEPLISQPSGESPIPQQCRHGVVLSPQRPGPGHAQSHGHGIGGVPRHKSIVDALLRLGETRQAVQLP